MNDNEVNDIIAEYMGLKVLEHAHLLGRDTRTMLVKVVSGNRFVGSTYDAIVYTKSLDELIPVWEKLKENEGFRIDIWSVKDQFKCKIYPNTYHPKDSDSLQQSAAYTTAKAIQELK